MTSSSNQSDSYQELDNLISKYIQTESYLATTKDKEATLRYQRRKNILEKCDTDIFKILYSEYEENHQMLPRHGYDLNKKNESDFKDNFCTLDSETNDIALNAVIVRYQDLFKPYQGSSSLVPVKQNSVDPVSSIIEQNPTELPKKSDSSHGDDWFAPFSSPFNKFFSSFSQISQATTIPSSSKPNEDWHTPLSAPLGRLFNPQQDLQTPRNAKSLPSPKPDNDWHTQLSLTPIADFFKLGQSTSQPVIFSPSKIDPQPITKDWLSSLFSPTATPPASRTIPDFSKTIPQPARNPNIANPIESQQKAVHPKTKPNTHEEAIAMAEEATRKAQEEAKKAWRKIGANPPSRILPPTRTAPVPLQETRSDLTPTAPNTSPGRPLNANGVAVFAAYINSPASNHAVAKSKKETIPTRFPNKDHSNPRTNNKQPIR